MRYVLPDQIPEGSSVILQRFSEDRSCYGSLGDFAEIDLHIIPHPLDRLLEPGVQIIPLSRDRKIEAAVQVDAVKISKNIAVIQAACLIAGSIAGSDLPAELRGIQLFA